MIYISVQLTSAYRSFYCDRLLKQELKIKLLTDDQVVELVPFAQLPSAHVTHDRFRKAQIQEKLIISLSHEDAILARLTTKRKR